MKDKITIYITSIASPQKYNGTIQSITTALKININPIKGTTSFTLFSSFKKHINAGIKNSKPYLFEYAGTNSRGIVIVNTNSNFLLCRPPITTKKADKASPNPRIIPASNSENEYSGSITVMNW